MSERFQRIGLIAPAMIAVLSVVAALGFRGVFPDWTFLAAAVIGASGATVVASLGRAFRLLLPEAIGASLVGFALLGGVAAGGVPTPDAYSTFADGLLDGWAQLLSSIPPASITGEFRVMPYTVGWVSAMIGCEALRGRRFGNFAVVGPLVGLTVSTLITVEDRSVALAQGAVLAAGGLAVARAHQGAGTSDDPGPADSDDASTPAPFWFSRWWRLATAFTVGVAVVTVAVLVGPNVPNADDNERFDLRQFVTPPFDPLAQPTPLSQVKVGLQDANADRVVFTATSDEPIERFTLAVLDTYTGNFWAVADETRNAPAEFRPVDRVFPAPSDGTIDGWTTTTATIEIVDLDRLAGGEFDPAWLPVPGWPLTVDSQQRLDLRFNESSGTLALAPDGPSAGLVYEVEAAVPPPIEDLTLQSATVTLRDPYDLAVPQLRSFAGDVLEGADLGWEQVEAIRSRLVDTGAYDSRAGSSAGRPGHSLGRLAEFVNDPDRLAGFEEQYAATAALMARSQGLPARIAVGFSLSPDELAERRSGDVTQVLASDIVAWLEVRFDGIGWIPFDVTPDRDREPEDTPVGRTEREVAVPNPPPEPPPPVLPPDLDLDADLDDEVEEPDDEATARGGGFPWRPVLVGVGLSLPVALLIGAMLLVVTLKRRRTIRRRHAPTPSLQVAGAWLEVMDRLVERGARRPPAATNRELAAGIVEASIVDPSEGDLLVELADDVDRAAFHPSPADDQVAEHAWERSDRIRTAVEDGLPQWRRVRYRLDPRPLRTKDPIAPKEDG